MLRAAYAAGMLSYEQINFAAHFAENSRTIEGYAQSWHIEALRIVKWNDEEVPGIVPISTWVKHFKFFFDELRERYGFVSSSKTRPINADLIDAQNMCFPVDNNFESQDLIGEPSDIPRSKKRKPPPPPPGVKRLRSSFLAQCLTKREMIESVDRPWVERPQHQPTVPAPTSTQPDVGFYSEGSPWAFHQKTKCSRSLWGKHAWA